MANNNENKVLNVPHLRFPEFSGEWDSFKLVELGKFIGGGTPSSSNLSFWTGSIPWISSSDIKEDNINNISISRYITEDAIEKSATKYCPAPVILIVSRVGVGKVALSHTSLCTSQDFCNIIDIKCHPVFLSYNLLRTMKRKSREVQGTSIKGITSDELQKIRVFIPKNKDEQNKISNLLTLLDERIATQNKIIEKLQSLIKGLNDNIHKGIKGETVCFSDLGEAYSGLSGKGGDDFGYGEPFITYMNVYQNTYISEKDYELVQIAPNEKQNSVQYGDALFTLSSETPEEVGIGAVYLGNTQKLYLNSFCFGIHFYDERVLPQYLAHFISSSSFRRAIYPLAQGSTRFNLQKNDFMKMKFLLPSLEKQGHIANTLDALHCRLANEKSLTEQYILLKKYLLSLMLI
ncbi:restriction endonuclease subunit S [Phocaeicola vulgatus]|uniref:restriction endonuclease subunit S n=1 Tax=Phocaeicola vulgatus TaxID=821 RepID=UPI0022E6CD49|nr:restriction endonuclease subunit S [Phocaeicola vulgatus]